MQNHLEIPLKSQFWIRNVEIGGKHKENIFFNAFLRKNIFVGLQTAFFDGFNELLSFLVENDAERFRNYFKKHILNPKHLKFDPNVQLL